ncbi:TatD family hydrolase [Mycetocola sp.]|uniref:TatD family hydrolase n=1 Tax=Mycetocola sp. TaxID=1871042 RepID=UPI003989AB80
MKLLDTHCHLGQYEEPSEVLRKAREANVSIVVATESPEEYKRLKTRIGSKSAVQVGLGLHPGSHAIRSSSQLSRFFRFLPETTWISEIGLDYGRSTSETDRRSQRRVLESILQHSLSRSKLVSFHSRGASADVVALAADNGIHGVLHWYSGDSRTAALAVKAGLYFSINEVMLRSSRGSKVIAEVPRSRLLLETDGPFTTSAGLPLWPSALSELVRQIAGRWDTEPKVVADQLNANVGALYRESGISSPAS